MIFYNNEHTGVGVVRDIDKRTGKIELYCYFLYDSKQTGYSMHETEVCSLYGYNFEGASISAQRRLNKELGRCGKVWNDRLHRIEPICCKVSIGQKYWYINDKMKCVEETEKGRPTSNFRYISGNYFTSYSDCLDYLCLFNEMLRDRLVAPERKMEGI